MLKPLVPVSVTESVDVVWLCQDAAASGRIVRVVIASSELAMDRMGARSEPPIDKVVEIASGKLARGEIELDGSIRITARDLAD